MAETFDWLKPSPLWQAGAADMLRAEFFRPALHEFRADTFMEDFLASAAAPTPKAFRESLAKTPAGRTTLKLFQPVHGCFYLTSASLCCRVPGFPDREVRAGEGESVFFVLRKKVNGAEHAWNVSETKRGWQPITGSPAVIQKDEERLPLFQTAAQGRNLFFGYVPVSSQDTYAAAVTLPAKYQEDPRVYELEARFTGPLENSFLFGTGPSAAAEPVARRISVYLLLDLLEYFQSYLPDVARSLTDNTVALTGAQLQLKNYLSTKFFTGTTLTMKAALAKVSEKQATLNEPGDQDVAALGFNGDYNLKLHPLTGLNDPNNANDLRDRVKAALAESQQTALAPVALPKLATDADAGDSYVLRYAYERAQCDPAHLYVSRPTAPFELAPFFDPDAPGRNIRVGLPVDVSIAGLRKFKKNVGFIISKELQEKLKTFEGQEEKVLDKEASDSGISVDIGFICSFSLPIITLCAFILLMIIVILLNFVFWWIPLLKICLPIPLFAKK
jgi:hypothetical protein